MNIKYTSKRGDTQVLCRECHKNHATWEVAAEWRAEPSKEPCSVCGKRPE